MKSKIFIITGLLAVLCFLQSCGNISGNKSQSEMDSSMHHNIKNEPLSSGEMKMDHGMIQCMSSMMGKMDQMKMTGDFDLDFANMMIMHHQAAIEMSEIEVAQGADSEIKLMAGNIIIAQKGEITQMQDFIKKHSMQAAIMKPAETHIELSRAMNDMMADMDSLQMTGNQDDDFVMMMIPHHECGVTMAKDELSHGHHSELKKIAQKMIADQTKEIEDFKAWNSRQ